MKKVLIALLCVLMTASLFGCKNINVSKEVNLRDKLTSLMTTDEALGVKGKYNTIEDIKDGSVDKDLTGTWKTADGSITYVYNEDGTAKASMEDYGETDTAFTCLTSGGYKIICEGSEMESTDAQGNTTTTTVVTFSTYNIDNGVLYMTNVEDTTDENITSSQYALVVLYRADDSGSIEESMSKNSIALDTFAGTWTSEKGDITIADGTLKFGEDVYDISMNDKGKLVVDKDGVSSEYSVNVSVMKHYEGEDNATATEDAAFGLYYTGADENDKPNLIDVLDDWGDFKPNYYSGTFSLQQQS